MKQTMAFTTASLMARVFQHVVTSLIADVHRRRSSDNELLRCQTLNVLKSATRKSSVLYSEAG